MRSFVRPLLLVAACALLIASCARQPAAPKQVSDPKHGKEIWLAISPLSGAGGVSANGVIQGHYFEDGAFLEVLGLNIAPAPAGFEYVGWLIRQKPVDRVRMDVLQSILKDARHQMQFGIQKDLRDHDTVEVRVVPVKTPQADGKIVATGKVKTVARYAAAGKASSI